MPMSCIRSGLTSNALATIGMNDEVWLGLQSGTLIE